MKTLFVVCQHGNEKTPYRVIKKHFDKKIDYLIANKEAFRKNKRFIENDLNRSFPGDNKGTKEERIAFLLKNKLSKYGQIVDLHTTTVVSPMFIITTSLSSKHMAFINKLNIKKVVYMKKSIASGNSLIDHVNLGVSIEVGKEGSIYAFNLYKKFIDSFLVNKRSKKKEYFVVFDILKKITVTEKLLNSIKSFKLVKKGQIISTIGNRKVSSSEDFYPIMPGEKSYKGILTLKAKKITEKDVKDKTFML